MQHKVFIALGSNLGDRQANLLAAINDMRAYIHIKAVSPSIETDAMYVTDQPAYCNMVLAAETDLAPLVLLKVLQAIEHQHGRTREVRYGARTLDLDILYYDDLVMHTDDLIIPHPRLHERRFVLEPLASIALDWKHPVTGKTTGDMLRDL